MIEYQEPHSTKRAYIKMIAWAVIFVFTWSQIAYSAGDLFHFKPIATPVALDPSLRGGGEDDEIEVTNYDLFQYEKKENPVHKLLPSMKEQEQTSGFAPNYLKRQQNKHEDVVRQKGVIDELLENLFNKRKPREEAEIPLKKKKSGPEGKSMEKGGTIPIYTLTEAPNDRPLNPHDLIQYIYDDKILKELISFNITKRDIQKWMSEAEEKTDDDGERYWVAYDSTAGLPGEDRIIKKVVLTGSEEDSKVDYILWGAAYAGGQTKYCYRSDHEQSGDDLISIKVYDVSGLSEEEKKEKGSGKLTQWSVFDGKGDDNKVVQHRYYVDGALYLRVDIEDGVKTGYTTTQMKEGEDREARGTGIKLFETFSKGEIGQENDDYTYYFNSEEEVTTTTVLIYVGGKRAGEADDNDPVMQETTYRGDAIAGDEYDADGNLLEGKDGIKDDARVSSRTIYDTVDRNQDEKVAILTYIYAEDGTTIQETIINIYESGNTGYDANYTENIKIRKTYKGDAVSDGVDADGDGVSDDDLDQDGIKDTAILEKEDYFDVFERAPGQGVLDYTLHYDANGAVTRTVVYYYYDDYEADEADRIKRARDARETADDNDPLIKTETYTIAAHENAIESDGSIKNDAKKLQETYYKGLKGNEISD